MHAKQAIRRNFARRAGTYDRHAHIQRFMGRELLSRCREAVAGAGRILEIGCGTGFLTAELRRLNPRAQLVAVDLDLALIGAARLRLGTDPRVFFAVADGEALGQGRFELIVSNSAFQWFMQPADTARRLWESLEAGGSLAFTALGPGTFKELAAAFREGAEAKGIAAWPRLAAGGFLSRQDWAGLLRQAGFAWVEVSGEALAVSFPSVAAFLANLRATGATNPEPKGFPPRLFKAMTAAYSRNFALNGGISATYDLILALARKT